MTKKRAKRKRAQSKLLRSNPKPVVENEEDDDKSSEKSAIVETVETMAAAFSGPLPPPEMLRAYDEVLPGSAKDFLATLKVEQAHRIKWENRISEAMIRQENQGQWFGFLIAVFAIVASVYLARHGNNLVAAILAGVTAVAFIGKFIPRRNSSS